MRARSLPAVLAVASGLTVALMFGAGNASAANPECATPATTWSQLRAQASAGGSYQLTCSLSAADTAGQQLIVGPQQSFTLDLDGSGLSIAPAAGAAAINVPGSSSLTVQDTAGGGELSGTASVAGALTLDSGATLTLPAGASAVSGTTTIDGTAINAGTVALSGTLNGDGTIANNGAITEAATSWSIPGNGTGAGGPTITGNIFELTFAVEFGPIPSAQWVYAPTFAASSETLPDPPPPGYQLSWDSGSSTFDTSAALSSLAAPVAGVQTVALTAHDTPIPPTITYALSSAVAQGRNGWWTAPLTVTFVCGGASGATLECPRPKTLKRSGKGLTVAGTVSAANGTSASVTATGIKLDLSRPAVRIVGAVNGATYTRTPRARCRATDRISGIHSCHLSRHIERGKRRETIRYTATATAGSGRTAKVTLTIHVARKA